MNLNLTQLSKTIAHALRHEPEAYDLQLDNEGWVPLEQLLAGLKKKGFPLLEKNDIILMARTGHKKRYDISVDRIRAFYGHSIAEKIVKLPQSPPDILYHGTSLSSVDIIMNQGLLPMDRQYVHLSVDVETAVIVAQRRKGETVLLKIKAQDAYQNGISFYKEENSIWLAEPIPSKYIYQ